MYQFHSRNPTSISVRATTDDYYNGNSKLPVYSRQPERLDTQETVNILLDPELSTRKICSSQPLNAEHNAIFVVDISKLEDKKDIYCVDMGSWKYNGVYWSWVEVDEDGFVTAHGKQQPMESEAVFHITKKYFVHKTSTDLKTVALLAGV